MANLSRGEGVNFHDSGKIGGGGYGGVVVEMGKHSVQIYLQMVTFGSFH